MKPAIWRRNNKTIDIDLDGHVFLVYEDNEQPVLGMMGGRWLLAVFSTKEKLDAYLPTLAPPAPTKVKQVNQGGSSEFIDSIHEGGVRIMIDPHVHNGLTRFMMVFKEGDS